MPRILIVGGDQSWVDGLRERLGRDACEITAAATARQAVERAMAICCDLVVVAPDLPHDATLELCRGLREQSLPAEPPLLLLPPVHPARAKDAGNEGHQHVRDLAGEIARLIRHAAARLNELRYTGDAESCLSLHGIEIDRECFRVTVDGRNTKLTPTEFRILWHLISRPGFVFSRQRLLQLSMGDSAPSYERTIDVHIKALRQKLGHRADLIETVRGIGYRFRDVGQGDAGNSPDPPA